MCWRKEFCRQYAALEMVSRRRVSGVGWVGGYVERHVSDSLVRPTAVSCWCAPGGCWPGPDAAVVAVNASHWYVGGRRRGLGSASPCPPPCTRGIARVLGGGKESGIL